MKTFYILRNFNDTKNDKQTERERKLGRGTTIQISTWRANKNRFYQKLILIIDFSETVIPLHYGAIARCHRWEAKGNWKEGCEARYIKYASGRNRVAVDRLEPAIQRSTSNVPTIRENTACYKTFSTLRFVELCSKHSSGASLDCAGPSFEKVWRPMRPDDRRYPHQPCLLA